MLQLHNFMLIQLGENNCSYLDTLTWSYTWSHKGIEEGGMRDNCATEHVRIYINIKRSRKLCSPQDFRLIPNRTGKGESKEHT